MLGSNKELYYDAHFSAIKQRYTHVLERFEVEQLLIFSGAVSYYFLDDIDYPFRASPQFKFACPVGNVPNSWVIWRLHAKPLLLLYRPVDYWHSVTPMPSEYWTEHFDIETLQTPEQAKAYVDPACKTAFVGEAASWMGDWELGVRNPLELMARLDWQRAAKTDYEQACMAEANRIAAGAHVAAQQAFLSGSSEFDTHLAYLKAAGQGEQQLPYGNIIAFNRSAAILHYTTLNTERPSQTQANSFLIDAGASCQGYAADVSRTHLSPGAMTGSRAKAAEQFAHLIEAMDSMQLKLVSQIEVGVSYVDLHLKAHRYLAEILAQFKLITVSAEAAFELGITRSFFPHGLGHFLGIQVHDVGGQQLNDRGGKVPPPEGHEALRTTRRIEVDQVFTIEPGLYFIDILLDALRRSDHSRAVNWTQVEALRPFGGIRIEDNVVVKPDRVINLTRDAFASLDC
ncbi:Xaa-Pro dipeptidase [Aestuariicella hydrocarbonica]|uniref:Xaa-Pro dipeptidase n=1 Tax=Pseudomaricurvus hydrocarbonicus TaxID=1470433 RepID=A0A9E5MGE8_9GAMM|nr:Xaa-Pro dipeptidase [Aestuariicella hydrocarbonica]NHO64566.1 Xaa-Pro dipeptidase [Aestuariicella hydrocarbonica]